MSVPVFAAILPAFITTKLFALVMAAIPVGAISFALYQQIKKFSYTVDQIDNAWTHRAVVTGVAFVLTAIGAALNVPIVCPPEVNCLNELTADKVELLVKALLGAGSAFALHAMKGGKK